MAIAIVAVIAVHYACYRRYRANAVLSTLTARTRMVYSMQALPQRSTLARTLIRVATRRLTNSPTDVDLWMAMAANSRILGLYEHAADLYRHAMLWGERPEIYLNLAEAEWKSGRRDLAAQHLALAAAFDPTMLVETENAEMRELALAALTKRYSREQLVRIYIAIAADFLSDGYYPEATRMIVKATLIDPRAITSMELRGFGGNDVALRYALEELARQKREIAHHQ